MEGVPAKGAVEACLLGAWPTDLRAPTPPSHGLGLPLLCDTIRAWPAACGLQEGPAHPCILGSGGVQPAGLLGLQGPRALPGGCGALPDVRSGEFTDHAVTWELVEVLPRVTGDKQAQRGQWLVQHLPAGVDPNSSPPPPKTSDSG